MPSDVVEQRSAVERPHELATVDAATGFDNECITRVTADGITSKRNHLGTQFLRVRNCRRGRCAKRAPWIQIGIMNRKREDYVYDTRALVFEGRPPYRLLSVSHPLAYAGISSRDFAYTHSIAWAEPRFEAERLIGYLDDRCVAPSERSDQCSIIVSVGVSDKGGALVETTVEALLDAQVECKSV